MKINELRFTNYRGHRTGNIAFENDVTIIVGKNGAGKSSVLQAVVLFLSWIIAKIRSEKGIGWYIDPLSITNGENAAALSANFDCFDEQVIIPSKAKLGMNKRYGLDIEGLRDYVSQIRSRIETTNYQTSIPVFAFYGVKRAVVDIPIRASHKEFGLFDAYTDCLNGSANFRQFFTWFRSQEDYENEQKITLHDPSWQSRELRAFRAAMSVLMPEYRNIHIRRRPLHMSVEKNGEWLNVAQLSDGEKIYFGLVGDLCQRLSLANPADVNLLDGEGIVLIDEADLHLHPAWQGEIVNRLHQVFPNIQFIITTHSPHVINRAQTRSLRILQDGQVTTAGYSYGIPSIIILKDIMAMEYDEPKEVVDMWDALINAISEKDVQGAKAALQHLQTAVPMYPGLARAHKLIEKLDR